jgi:hypothetical protein
MVQLQVLSSSFIAKMQFRHTPQAGYSKLLTVVALGTRNPVWPGGRSVSFDTIDAQAYT